MSKRHLFSFFCIALIFNTALLLASSLLSPVVAAGIGVVFVWFIFYFTRQLFPLRGRLFLAIIVLVPTSFLSIIGGDYGVLPLSWYNLLVLILFVTVCRKSLTDKWSVCTILALAVFSVVSLILVDDKVSALKQIFSLMLFMMSFVIGFGLVKEKPVLRSRFIDVAKVLYIQTVVIFSLTVLLQQFLITTFGLEVGHYGAYGSDRISYAGLMQDYSFASLYIATGILLLLFMYADHKVKNLLIFLSAQVAMLLAIMTINARTGLFALAIGLAIWVLWGFSKGKRRVLMLGVVVLFSVAVLANSIYAARGGQSFFDDSGRGDAYSTSLVVFADHPIAGIGFGDTNFTRYIGDSPLPHNFFIQYLLQAGILGSSIILLGFLGMFRRNIAKDVGIFTIFIATMAGAMLIPDIVNSRYLFVIVVLCIVTAGLKKKSFLQRTKAEDV